VAGLVSLPLVLPAIDERLSPSGQWGVGVPQTAFCLVLSISLATSTGRADEREATWFRLLRTAYIAVLVLPVLVFGGGIEELGVPMAALSVIANVALVYFTFKVSRRPYVTEPATAPSGTGDTRDAGDPS
jgi:uncharacterized membrane protein